MRLRNPGIAEDHKLPFSSVRPTDVEHLLLMVSTLPLSWVPSFTFTDNTSTGMCKMRRMNGSRVSLFLILTKDTHTHPNTHPKTVTKGIQKTLRNIL